MRQVAGRAGARGSHTPATRRETPQAGERVTFSTRGPGNLHDHEHKEPTMPEVEVKVTQEHIENGTIDCSSCPIALALQDVSLIAAAWVDEHDLEIELTEEKSLHISPPRHIADFIRRFDNGEPVEPTSFSILI
jgi:hypothetical protein